MVHVLLYFSFILSTNIYCVPVRYWARHRANSGESIMYTILALMENTNLWMKDGH